ncbi:Endonuclease-reverse transcriptase, partial [Operophtera brumata]
MLTNLRFTDDLVLFSESVGDMLSMIEDLKILSEKVGLKMNLAKTKIMTNILEAENYQMPVDV